MKDPVRTPGGVAPRDDEQELTAGRTACAGRADRLDLLLVGALIAGVSTLYALYAVRIGNFQDDEEQYLQQARYVAMHFPGALWRHGIFVRGLQRLDQLILAIPFALTRGPSAFEIAHAIQCALFASTALPVLLLARRAGLGRVAGLFAATLAVVVPWAVVSTSFLAESAAYPAFGWVLYATWLAIRKPSTGHDLLALAALAVAALSRTAMIALAPMLPLAAIWHEWSWELRATPLRRRARELPGRLWTRHRLLTVVVGIALLALLIGELGLLPGRGISSLAGDYGLPQLESISAISNRYLDYVSRLVAGTSFLAVVLALPWVLANLARPRQSGRAALASVCALAVAAILLSLLQAPLDERYVLYGAAPIALGAAAALNDWAYTVRRNLGMAIGIVVSACLVVVVLASVSWPEVVNQYDFFSFPAGIFYRRALLSHLSTVSVPLAHPSTQLLLYLAILLTAVAFASLVRARRAARPAAALLALALIGACATQMIYAIKKYSETAGAASGPNQDERSWVDRHVPGSVNVGALGISLGATLDYLPIWRALEFWNTSVHYDTYFGNPGFLPFPVGSESRPLTAQPQSGLLSAANESGGSSPRFVPRYMLLPQQGTNSVGLDTMPIGVDPYLPVELVKLAQPPRLEWGLNGTSAEGFLPAGTPVTATVYSSAFAHGDRRCASFSLIAPPAFAGRWPYRVTGTRGQTLARGELTASQTAHVTVALHPTSGGNGPSAQLSISVSGGEVAVAGGKIGTTLAFFAVGDCPAR